MSSASILATSGAAARGMVRFSERVRPTRGWWKILSLESEHVWTRTLSMAWRTHGSPLYTLIRTETRVISGARAGPASSPRHEPPGLPEQPPREGELAPELAPHRLPQGRRGPHSYPVPFPVVGFVGSLPPPGERSMKQDHLIPDRIHVHIPVPVGVPRVRFMGGGTGMSRIILDQQTIRRQGVDQPLDLPRRIRQVLEHAVRQDEIDVAQGHGRQNILEDDPPRLRVIQAIARDREFNRVFRHVDGDGHHALAIILRDHARDQR